MQFVDSEFFFYTDIFNSLQGVYVFIIFVMNPRALRLARERFVVTCKTLFKLNIFNEQNSTLYH